MDKKALIQLLVTFVMGAVAGGGALYLQSGNPATALNAGLMAGLLSVVNHIRETPLTSRPTGPNAIVG